MIYASAAEGGCDLEPLVLRRFEARFEVPPEVCIEDEGFQTKVFMESGGIAGTAVAGVEGLVSETFVSATTAWGRSTSNRRRGPSSLARFLESGFDAIEGSAAARARCVVGGGD